MVRKIMSNVNLGHREGNARSRVSEEGIEEVRQPFSECRYPQGFYCSKNTCNDGASDVAQLSALFSIQAPKYAPNGAVWQRRSIGIFHYCQKHADGYSQFFSRIIYTEGCMFRLNSHVTPKMLEFGGDRVPEWGEPSTSEQSGHYALVWCLKAQDYRSFRNWRRKRNRRYVPKSVNQKSVLMPLIVALGFFSIGCCRTTQIYKSKGLF